MPCFVYLISCVVNGKNYVGWTKGSIEQRFLRHCYNAASGSQFYVHRAIRKYGRETFRARRLAEVSSPKEAQGLEREFIAELRTNDARFGYNLTVGGEGGPGAKGGVPRPIYKFKNPELWLERQRVSHLGKQHSMATRLRMSDSHRGHTCSLETRQILSQQKMGCNNPMKNPDTSKKVSRALCGRTQPAKVNLKRAATMRRVWEQKKRG